MTLIETLTRLAGQPIIWTALWVIVAAGLSSLPTKRAHWPLAYVLMVVGAPILVWAWAVSPLQGLAATAAGVLTLRWPIRYGISKLTGRPVR